MDVKGVCDAHLCCLSVCLFALSALSVCDNCLSAAMTVMSVLKCAAGPGPTG